MLIGCPNFSIFATTEILNVNVLGNKANGTIVVPLQMK